MGPFTELLIINLQAVTRMTELGLFEFFELGEAVGIIATFIVVLYYSRKQMQKITVDVESKILNDLDDKMHNLSEITIPRPVYFP